MHAARRGTVRAYLMRMRNNEMGVLDVLYIRSCMYTDNRQRSKSYNIGKQLELLRSRSSVI